MVVVGDERRGDAIVPQEHGRHPRVLAGDEIGGGQCLQGTERDVAEVADRGGDDMQAGRQGSRRHAVPPDLRHAICFVMPLGGGDAEPVLKALREHDAVPIDGERSFARALGHVAAALFDRKSARFGLEAKLMTF